MISSSWRESFDEWVRREVAPADVISEQLLRKCWDAAWVSSRQETIDLMGCMIICPCCEGVTDCEGSCTFIEDYPDEANTMEVLREAVQITLNTVEEKDL